MNDAAQAVLSRQPLQDTQVIDAHAHLGPYSLFFIADHSPKSMVRVMDRCGVDLALVSSHRAIQEDASKGNDETARAVDETEGRIRGYFVVNPWQDPVKELEARADDSRFVGIKLHPELHQYALTSPRYQDVYAFAEQQRLPVLTHSWHGSHYNGLAEIGAVAERYPDLALLAGHAGATGPGYEEIVDVARRHPNILLELCGSFGTGQRIKHLVDELGAHRVVFGSDFPFLDLRLTLGRVLFAPLEDADRRAILGGTVAAVLDRATKAA